ncbi:DUF397 domain-containing protein [Streptomyces scopuliridis]|uniref:DUF397 domain-containing protein n=1 Tax=Streptomyces scopuliridis TaxID=452529 RepID=UPI00368794C0
MPDPKWLKSSYSEASGNNCVEVAVEGQHFVALRDSTRPGHTVVTNRTAFRMLVRGLASKGFGASS